MGTTVRCARCGAAEDSDSAAMSEQGLVCSRCHAADVAGDAQQMQAELAQAGAVASGVPWDGDGGGPGVVISQSSTSRRAVAVPASGACATLLARGVACERHAVRIETSGLSGGSGAEGYAERWVLPSRPSVQASFVAERFAQKVAKLFSREVQAGDPAFDAAVYVRTDTRDATAALLRRGEVREAIQAIVSHGGHVAISGNAVEGEVSWPDAEPGPRPADLVARVALALLEG